VLYLPCVFLSVYIIVGSACAMGEVLSGLCAKHYSNSLGLFGALFVRLWNNLKSH
jgi:hypothetical protein